MKKIVLVVLMAFGAVSLALSKQECINKCNSYKYVEQRQECLFTQCDIKTPIMEEQEKKDYYKYRKE